MTTPEEQDTIECAERLKDCCGGTCGEAKVARSFLSLRDELSEARRKLDVAREAIEKAPHEIGCLAEKQTCLNCGLDYGNHYGKNCSSSSDFYKWNPPLIPQACNCWKSRALAQISEPQQEGKKPIQRHPLFFFDDRSQITAEQAVQRGLPKGFGMKNEPKYLGLLYRRKSEDNT